MNTAFHLQAHKDPQGRMAILRTEGYINNQAGERIGEAAKAILAEGTSRLVINLEKSTVINSIGISILIEVMERIQDHQGALAFCCLTKTIAKTFTIMGLTHYASIHDTEVAAVSWVAQN